MLIKKIVVLIIITFICLDLFAKPQKSTSDFEFGAGINSYTGGRTIPSIELSYLLSDQAFSWAATGVRNKYYYQSSHLLFYFKTWVAGTMWGGDVTSGFGGGAGYSTRNFQDYNATQSSTRSDFLLGPAIRLNWSYGLVYLNFSVVYGLRNLQNHIIGLTFQNVESLTLGLRF